MKEVTKKEKATSGNNLECFSLLFVVVLANEIRVKTVRGLAGYLLLPWPIYPEH